MSPVLAPSAIVILPAESIPIPTARVVLPAPEVPVYVIAPLTVSVLPFKVIPFEAATGSLKVIEVTVALPLIVRTTLVGITTASAACGSKPPQPDQLAVVCQSPVATAVHVFAYAFGAEMPTATTKVKTAIPKPKTFLTLLIYFLFTNN